MEKLFNDIQQKIKTDVTEIRWIDIDEGQLDIFGENIPIDFPCVLVDFPSADFSNASDPLQMGDYSVTLKVAFKMVERLNTSVPTTFRQQAFQHFDILKKVMKAIHTLEGQWYSPLSRVSFRKEKSIDPKVYTIVFETAITDNDFDDTLNTIPKPDFEIETFLN